MEERKLGMQITVLPKGTTAKQALEMVYREIVLTPQQMRAAIECLQFEVPKVSAVAVAHLNENDFASALDRAIERSKSPPMLNGTVQELPAEELKKPFQSYRRM